MNENGIAKDSKPDRITEVFERPSSGRAGGMSHSGSCRIPTELYGFFSFTTYYAHSSLWIGKALQLIDLHPEQ